MHCCSAPACPKLLGSLTRRESLWRRRCSVSSPGGFLLLACGGDSPQRATGEWIVLAKGGSAKRSRILACGTFACNAITVIGCPPARKINVCSSPGQLISTEPPQHAGNCMRQCNAKPLTCCCRSKTARGDRDNSEAKSKKLLVIFWTRSK